MLKMNKKIMSMSLMITLMGLTLGACGHSESDERVIETPPDSQNTGSETTSTDGTSSESDGTDIVVDDPASTDIDDGLTSDEDSSENDGTEAEVEGTTSSGTGTADTDQDGVSLDTTDNENANVTPENTTSSATDTDQDGVGYVDDGSLDVTQIAPNEDGLVIDAGSSGIFVSTNILNTSSSVMQNQEGPFTELAASPLEMTDFNINDSDRDGINNNDDWCPTAASENEKGTEGKASIVFFNLIDSDFINFFQETIHLDDAFDGYDYKVLLYDTDDTITSSISSSAAISHADEILEPSKDNLVATIKSLTQKGYMIDIYIISHGGPGHYTWRHYPLGSSDYNAYDSHGNTYDIFYNSYIDHYFSTQNTGCQSLPIRLVYSVTCYGYTMSQNWIDIGAKVTVESRSINYYPLQFAGFARHWTGGESAEDSYDASNTSAIRTATQAWIEIEGLSYSLQGECTLIPNVLGENDCAEWFFTGGSPNDINEYENLYNSSMSGKENMNRASEKIILGDENITFNSRLSWE